MSSRFLQLDNVGHFKHTSSDGRIVVYSLEFPYPDKLFIQDIPPTRINLIPPDDLQYSFYRKLEDGTLKEIPVPAHSPMWYEAIRQDIDANTDAWIAQYITEAP